MWNIKEKLFLHYKKERLTWVNMPLIIVFRLLGYAIGVWVVLFALILCVPIRLMDAVAHVSDWLGIKLHMHLLRECRVIIEQEIIEQDSIL